MYHLPTADQQMHTLYRNKIPKAKGSEITKEEITKKGAVNENLREKYHVVSGDEGIVDRNKLNIVSLKSNPGN